MNKSREIILERLKNNSNEIAHTKVEVTKKMYEWSNEEMISKLSEKLQFAKAR